MNFGGQKYSDLDSGERYWFDDAVKRVTTRLDREKQPLEQQRQQLALDRLEATKDVAFFVVVFVLPSLLLIVFGGQTR